MLFVTSLTCSSCPFSWDGPQPPGPHGSPSPESLSWYPPASPHEGGCTSSWAGSSPQGILPLITALNSTDHNDLFICLSHLMCVLSCSVEYNSFQPRGLKPARLLFPWGYPGKNTGVGYHFLFQEIFPTQKSNLCLLWLPHWQADSLPLSQLGSLSFPPLKPPDESFLKNHGSCFICLLSFTPRSLCGLCGCPVNICRVNTCLVLSLPTTPPAFVPSSPIQPGSGSLR